MSSTTSSANFLRQNLLNSQAQVYVRGSLPIIDLNAIGDDHTLSTSFIEQLSAVNSIAFETVGVTGTRTADIEFRHSPDNTTWTAWAAATLGNLQSVAYVADNRAYFQWRFTRGGSDATGIISIRAVSLGFTFDPSAMSGHGAFTSWGITDEIFLFLKEIIASVSTTSSYGGNRFEVLPYELNQNSKATKNVILVAGIRTGRGTANTISSDNYPCQCQLFIKMQGKNGGDNQGFSTEAGWMRGTLLDIFRERNWAGNRFTFTFKSVDFVAAPLSVLGMTKFSIDDLGPTYVSGYDGAYTQLQLNFTIFATRNTLGNTYG
jgi:hypothetical protein